MIKRKIKDNSDKVWRTVNESISHLFMNCGGKIMFKCQEIKSLNVLELEVYNYIMRHKEQVVEMKIRELAEAAHVSTTTILRFCKKVGCNGYSEFKLKYKMYLNQTPKQAKVGDIGVLLDFLNRTESDEFNQKLDEVASLLYYAQKIILIGVGNSGILAKYGARYLSSVGKLAQHIDDPYYPVPSGYYDSSVIIILSVSGESDQTMEQLKRFTSFNCVTIAITSSEMSTIAKMSDVTLTYYVPIDRGNLEVDLTTQVPVLYILEKLGKKLQVLLCH